MLLDTLFYAIDIDQAPRDFPTKPTPTVLYALGNDNYVYTAPMSQDTSKVQFTRCKSMIAPDVAVDGTPSAYAGIYVYQNIIYVRAILKRDGGALNRTLYIIRSTDEGNTWVVKKELKAMAFHFYISKKTGYLYQPHDNMIFVSRDRGDSWVTYDTPAISLYSRIIGSNEASVIVRPNVLAAFTASHRKSKDVKAVYFTLEDDIQFQLVELPDLSSSDGYSRFAVNDIIFDEYEQIVYVFSSIQQEDGTQGKGIIIDYFTYTIVDNKLILPKSDDIKSIIQSDGPTLTPVQLQFGLAPDVIAGFKFLSTQVGIIDMVNNPEVSFQMYNLDGNGYFKAQENTQTSFRSRMDFKVAWSTLKVYNDTDSNIYYAFLDGDGILRITSNSNHYTPWVPLNGPESTAV